MLKFITLFFFLLLLPPAPARSQYLDVKSLKGLDSLAVWIESLNDNIDGKGLTKEGLKTDVEGLLRKAGMKVVTDAPANLYLTVSTLEDSGSGNYACNIKLEVLQGVWIERTDEWNYASTWFREYLGIYPGKNLVTEIRSTVAELVDLFTHDALPSGKAVPEK